MNSHNFSHGGWQQYGSPGSASAPGLATRPDPALQAVRGLSSGYVGSAAYEGSQGSHSPGGRGQEGGYGSEMYSSGFNGSGGMPSQSSTSRGSLSDQRVTSTGETHAGKLVRFNEPGNFGFINSPELESRFRSDVLCLGKSPNLGIGDDVMFELVISTKGEPQAINLRRLQESLDFVEPSLKRPRLESVFASSEYPMPSAFPPAPHLANISAPAGSGARPKNFRRDPCKQWVMTEGFCRYGDACTFLHTPLNLTAPSSMHLQGLPAHAIAAPPSAPFPPAPPVPFWEDPRFDMTAAATPVFFRGTPPDEYKKHPCRMWMTTGVCKYARSCVFLHSEGGNKPSKPQPAASSSLGDLL